MKNCLVIFFMVVANLAFGQITPSLKYKYIPVAISEIPNGVYRFQSAIGDKSMDVMWGNNANGVGIHLWDTHNGDAQLFTVEPSNEPGFYYIRTKWGRAIDVAGYNPNPGAALNTYDLHGGDNQKWQFVAIGDGYHTIKSKYGTYIDVQNGNSASGTPVWMYSKNGSTAQKWKLVPKSIVIPASVWSKSFVEALKKVRIYANNYTPVKNQYDPSGERAFFRPDDAYVYTSTEDGTQLKLPIKVSVYESGLDKACKNYLQDFDTDLSQGKTSTINGVFISIGLPLKGKIIANCYNNACCNNPFCNAGCKDEILSSRLQIYTIVEVIDKKLSYRKIDVAVGDYSIGGGGHPINKELQAGISHFYNGFGRSFFEKLLNNKIPFPNYREMEISPQHELVLRY